MFKRKIRLFFVNYGKLLFYIIGVIAIFFIFLNALNNYAARKNRKAAQEKAVQQEINIKKRVFVDNFRFMLVFFCYSLLLFYFYI